MIIIQWYTEFASFILRSLYEQFLFFELFIQSMVTNKEVGVHFFVRILNKFHLRMYQIRKSSIKTNGTSF